ncbi:hypothetical protein DXG01_004330 [Tephrocybe rancida]|nr:hypothetical protein DXG01_004330 [Tephrocybe rancida]
MKCVVMDPVTRLAGGIALWSIEIIMQLRVYALYQCSRTVAIVNGGLFLCSIAGFAWVLIHNTEAHFALIANVVELPLPGCPSIHSGLEWLQWIPATAFEILLFGFALFKTLSSSRERSLLGIKTVSLYELVVRDNLLYFFTPFHAAMGILTTRMLLNIHKAVTEEVNSSLVVQKMWATS